jgi:hypothetical protein
MLNVSEDEEDLWTRVYEFGDKQFRIREFWGDETVGLGGTVWSASIRLCEFMMMRPDLIRGRRVLELGSGCSGLVGMIALEVLRASSVVFTDRQDVLPYLQENIDANISSCAAYKTMSLDWCQPFDLPDDIDLVVAAECIYDTTAISPFLTTCLRIGRPVLMCGIIGSEAYTQFCQELQTRNISYEIIERATDMKRNVLILNIKSELRTDDSMI